MTIAIRATATSQTTSITIPASTQVGDIIILHGGAYNQQPTLPAGWTQLQGAGNGYTYYHYGVLGWKTAVSGDIGATVTFGNLPFPQYGGLQCIVVSGAAASPIRASNGVGGGPSGTGDITSGAITPVATDLVLGFFGQMGTTGAAPSIAVPSGTTSRTAVSGSAGYGGVIGVSATGLSVSTNWDAVSNLAGGNAGFIVALISGTTNYTRTATDSISAPTDVSAQMRTTYKTGTDSISAPTDANVRVFTGSRFIYDRTGPTIPAPTQGLVRDPFHPVFLEPPGPPTDAVALAFVRARTAADSTTTTDAAIRTTVYKRDLADSAPATDGVVRVLIPLKRTAADSVAGIADSAVRYAVPFKRGPPADSAPATDSAVRTTIYRRNTWDWQPQILLEDSARGKGNWVASNGTLYVNAAGQLGVTGNGGGDGARLAVSARTIVGGQTYRVSVTVKNESAYSQSITAYNEHFTPAYLTSIAFGSGTLAAGEVRTFEADVVAPGASIAANILLITQPVASAGFQMATYGGSITLTSAPTDSAVRAPIFKRTAADTAPASDVATRYVFRSRTASEESYDNAATLLGPVAQIDLDDNSGGTFTNVTTGQPPLAPALGRSSLFGAGSQVDLAANANLNLNGTSFTIAAWINATSWTNAWNQWVGSQSGGMAIGVTGASHNLALTLTNIQDAPAGPVLATGTTYHVVAVYDSAAHTVTYYVNGVAYGPYGWSPSTANSGQTLRVGNSQGYSAPFTGAISDVAIYRTALTGAQISDLYQRGATAVYDAVAWIRLIVIATGADTVPTPTDAATRLRTVVRSATDTAPAVDQNVRQDFFFRSPADSIAGLADGVTRTGVFKRDVGVNLSSSTAPVSGLPGYTWHIDAANPASDTGTVIADLAGSNITQVLGAGATRETYNGVPVWNLDNGVLDQSGGTDYALGQNYTAWAWIDWRDGDAGWRTVLRGTQDHWILVENNAKRIGMYANRSGEGFRPVTPNYNINPTGWQLVTVVGRGTTPTSSVGTTDFYINGEYVGSADRVSSGDTHNAVGWAGQGPGRIAESGTFATVAFTPDQVRDLFVRTKAKYGYGTSDVATRNPVFKRTATDSAPAADGTVRSNGVFSRAVTEQKTGFGEGGFGQGGFGGGYTPWDTPVRLLTPPRTATDIAPASDVAARYVFRARTAADSTTTTDGATRYSFRARTATDSSTTTDAAVRGIVLFRTGAESAPASDVATRYSSRARTASDSTTTTDATQRSTVYLRAPADTAPASDAAARYSFRARTASDAVTPADTAVRAAIAYQRGGGELAFTPRRTARVLIVSNLNSNGNLAARLTALGYAVTLNTAATTLADLDGYDIIAADDSAWSVQKGTLLSQAYDAGYSIFSSGNDTTTGHIPQITSGISKTVAQPYDLIPVGTHYVGTGWTQVLNIDSDTGTLPTGLRAGAIPVATMRFGNTTGYMAFVEEHATSGARWFHYQDQTTSATAGALTLLARGIDWLASNSDQDVVTRLGILPRLAQDLAAQEDTRPYGGLVQPPFHAVFTTTGGGFIGDWATFQVIGTRSAADSLSTSDSAARTATYGRALADSTSTSDAATRFSLRSRTAADTAPASDVAARYVFRARSAADSTSTTDAATRQPIFKRSTADSAPAFDADIRNTSFYRTATDSVAGLADAATRTTTYQRALADSTATADTATRIATHPRTTADTAPASDAAIRSLVARRTTQDSRYTSAVIARGPIGYWKLGDATKVATDQMGHHGVHSGTALGAASLLPVETDGATTFPGNARVTIPHSADFLVSTLSIVVWAKTPATWGGVGSWRALVARQDAGRDFNFYGYSSDGVRLTHLHLSSTVWGAPQLALPTPLDPNTIHQIAVTISATQFRFFIDGVLVATTAATAGTLTRTSTVLIGAADNYWSGDLDEVAIYGRALADSEIADDYLLGTKDADDVASRSLTQYRTGWDNAGAVAPIQGSTLVSPVVAPVFSTGGGVEVYDAAVRTILPTRTTADTAPASDGAARAVVYKRSVAETLAVTDTANRTGFPFRTATDAAPASDALARSGTFKRNTADSAPAAETLAEIEIAIRAVSDSVTGVADVATRQPVFKRSGSDSAPASDASVQNAPRFRTTTDVVTPTDVAVRTTVYKRTTAEALTTTDGATRFASRSRTSNETGPFVVGDAASRFVYAPRAGTEDTTQPVVPHVGLVAPVVHPITTSGIPSLPYDVANGSIFFGRVASDSAPAVDTLGTPALHLRTAADTAPAADATARTTTYRRGTRDQANYVPASFGGLVQNPFHPVQPFAEGDANDDAARWVANYRRVGDDALLTSDVLVTQTWHYRTATDSAPAAEALVSFATHPRTATDAAPASDALVAGRLLKRSAAETVTVTEALLRKATYQRALADSAPASDFASVVAPAHANDSAPATDSVARKQWLIRATAETPVSIPRRVPGLVQPIVHPVPADEPYLVTTDDAVRAQNLFRRIGDDAVLGSDAVSSSVLHIRSLAESVPAASDVLARWVANNRLARDDANFVRPTTGGLVRPLVFPLNPQGDGEVDDVARWVAYYRRLSDDAVLGNESVLSWVLHPRSAADNAPATDANAHLTTHIRSLAESAPATDQDIRQTFFFRAVTETVTPADTATRANYLLHRITADAAPVTDNASAVPPGRATDAAPATDAATRIGVFKRAPADTAPITDAAAGLGLRARTTADSLATADSVARAIVLKRSAAEALATPADAGTIHRNEFRSAADSAPVGDVVTRTSSYLRGTSDTAPAADLASRTTSYGRVLNESAPASDTVVRRSLLFADCLHVLPEASDTPTTTLFARRGTGDVAPTSDAVASPAMRFRSSSDAAPAADLASRVAHEFRSNPRTPPYISDYYDPPIDKAYRTGAFFRAAIDLAPANDQTPPPAPIHIRSLAEVLPAVSDALVAVVHALRASADAAPAQDNLWVARHLDARRAAAETVTPADSASRSRSRATSAADTAPVTETPTRFFSGKRTGSDGASVTDSTARLLVSRRSSADSTSTADALVAHRLRLRALLDLLPTPVDAGTRMVAQARTATDLVLVPVDALWWLQTHRLAFGPPVAEITSISRTKVGIEPGCDTVEISFTFDRPVNAWAVRVNSTGPFDGNLAADWTGASSTSDTAIVSADLLLHGPNEVVVYGRSLEGVWSFRPVGDLAGAR